MTKNNKNIVFCTLAYNDRFKELSKQELLNSYNKYVPDYKLIIATDDPSYYDNEVRLNKNVIPFKIELNLRENEPFPYNVKLFPIDYVFNNFSPQCIVYLDADCRFNRREDFDNFLTLSEGLSVILGRPSTTMDINNMSIQQKAEALISRGSPIYQFKEAGLVFRINSRDKMRKFINEWDNILHICLDHKLTQNAECIDIGIACQRSEFPILDLRENCEIYRLLGYDIFSTRDPITEEYSPCLM